MTNRPAVLTLPGLSTTTLLANLANVMDLSDSRTPVILVDTYDYERLRGRHLKGIGENQKAPYLGMIYDELQRRGIIRLIDYSKYYPNKVQQQYLQQNQKLVKEMSESLHKQMAMKGVKSWKRYGRGSYQEPVREALGEDKGTFAASRREEEGLYQKIKRGRGNPIAWNRKLLNKSVAALEIRRRADQNLKLDIDCVVAGPEHEIIIDLLTAARAQRSTELTTDILDIGPGDVNTKIPHSKGSDPLHNIASMEPELNADAHEVFNTITKVASDIVGRGGDKWVLLGTSLAMPQYSDIFNANRIQAQVRGKMDINDLTSETKQAIDTIKCNSEMDDPSGKIRYEADKIAEKYNVSDIDQNRNLDNIINQAIAMSNYSVELDSLVDENDLSQAAIFTAASILSDPIHRYDENDIYRHSLDLAARLDLSGIDNTELKQVGMESSGITWGKNHDWFEDPERKR